MFWLTTNKSEKTATTTKVICGVATQAMGYASTAEAPASSSSYCHFRLARMVVPVAIATEQANVRRALAKA